MSHAASPKYKQSIRGLDVRCFASSFNFRLVKVVYIRAFVSLCLPNKDGPSDLCQSHSVQPANLYRSSSWESSFTLSHWYSMRTFHVPVEAPSLSTVVDGLAPVLHFRFPIPGVYQRGTWSLLDMASIRHDIFGFLSNHSPPVIWLVHWVVFTSFPSRDPSTNGHLGREHLGTRTFHCR